MALVLRDRVRDTTATVGVGPFVLNNTPPQGYQSFADVGDGNTTYYAATDGARWETGLGTYHSFTHTLTRDQIFESSNNNLPVNFLTGFKAVFCTLPASKAFNADSVIPPQSGGTGISSYTIGDLLYASAPTTLSKLSDIAVGNVLLTGGVGLPPVYGKVGLESHVTGILPVPNGGTGAMGLTGFIVGNGTNPFTAVPTLPINVISGTKAEFNTALTDGDFVFVGDQFPASDISGGQALTKVDDTNVTLTLGGGFAAALLSTTSLTMGWTGQLSVPRGGTGASTLTGYLKGNGTGPFTGVSTIPVTDVMGTKAGFNNALTDGDFLYVGDTIPASGITGGQPLTKTDDTNVTLTLGGSPTAALLASTSLTVGWAGQLAVGRGGTGAATLTGYIKGNGTSPLVGVATIPVADVTGAVPEAPNDGQQYARKNLAWSVVTSAVPEAPIDGLTYGRKDAAWISIGSGGGIPEAPNDGKLYARGSLAWANITPLKSEHTATAGQTVFTPTFTYTVGSVGVYVNGVRLANAEFTATNGTTVTLAAGVAAGDIVLIETTGATGGAGGGSGTVTSVGLSGGTTGLTVSGSPVTTSGTMTLGGTLAPANGGFPEAPNDGQQYARQSLGWAVVTGGGGGGLPPSTMAQFDTALTDGNFVFQNGGAGLTNLTVNGVASVNGQFVVAGAATTVNISAPTGSLLLGQDQTSGTISLGGLSGTGNITLGQSTDTQTLGLGIGAVASGKTKTLNIGTGGVAGSTTTINIGSTNGSTTAVQGTFTQANGQFTVTTGNNPVSIGSTQSVCNFGSTQTTGAINMGGTGATGVISIGRSTANQTLDLAMGATASGSTKTVSIGANGVSGSTTNITYGSAVAGATTTHTFNGNTVKNGNLTFSGTGRRIIGDFSDGTTANRLCFQSSVTNGVTAITAIPNGTGVTSALQLHNNSNTANSSFFNILTSSTELSIQSERGGSGSYLPLSLWTSSTKRFQIDQGGTVVILRDGSSELRLMNQVGTHGYRLIQGSSASAIGDLTIQGTNDGFVSNFTPNVSLTSGGIFTSLELRAAAPGSGGMIIAAGGASNSGYIRFTMPDTTSAGYIGFANNSAGSHISYQNERGSGGGHSFGQTCYAPAFTPVSDRKLKENIAPASDDPGPIIDAIQIRQFDWKGSGGHQSHGVIAQELHAVYPESVHVPHEENTEGVWAYDPARLLMLALKEIQQLRTRVAELEARA